MGSPGWNCGKLDGIFYAFFPKMIPHGPLSKTLDIWDELLTRGQAVVAIGGSDAHAQHKTLGPIHKIIFPYKYHFSTVNTHILTPEALTGNLINDREMVLDALSVVITLVRRAGFISPPRQRKQTISWAMKSSRMIRSHCRQDFRPLQRSK